jgi:hypothetical protein
MFSFCPLSLKHLDKMADIHGIYVMRPLQRRIVQFPIIGNDNKMAARTHEVGTTSMLLGCHSFSLSLLFNDAVTIETM